MSLPCLFSEIDLFIDSEEKEGALQMAMDEVLLRNIKWPLLRHYRWKGSWVSFGYFQKWSEIQPNFLHRQLVRRWSGGGAVDHKQDWTFSLIIPASHPFRCLSVGASYQEIHLRLKGALSEYYEGVQEVPKEDERPGPQCFLSPRRSDLWWNGRKIAGGAQRRSLSGLLHQGSIQGFILPQTFASVFASYLAPRTNSFHASEAIQDEAIRVCKERYTTQEWLQKL
jgi:lipoate-protein ligase A